MPKFFKSTIALSCLMLTTTLSGCADAQQAPANKDQIEQIVYDYLMENPEIIREALIALQAKEERQSIIAVQSELRDDKRDYSFGPKNAKVTVVEFFDYNCSFCKESTAWVQDILVKYPDDVRVVFKELPILERRTLTSRNAAKAALAAGRQGKYREMHLALMAGTSLTEKFITSEAIKMGLNMTKFNKDMLDDRLEEQLEDGMILAASIPGLTGTPFFVINDTFLASGNTDALDRMLNTALSQ